MTFKEIVEWLLNNQYMMLVGGKPILTPKFEREVGYTGPSTVGELIEERHPQREIARGSPLVGITDPKKVWNIFIIDAEIPHRVKSTDGSTYTVRQYGASVAKKLLKIIHDPKINYQRLVESTKNYYKVTTYKQLLSNYISKDIWWQEYQEWSNQTKKDNTNNDGYNLWED